MSSWPELLEGTENIPRLYEGIIAEDIPDVNTPVTVIIPAFHLEREWGPAPWMPRVDDTGTVVYPATGDRCVVALAESVEPGTPEVWIVAWWTN